MFDPGTELQKPANNDRRAGENMDIKTVAPGFDVINQLFGGKKVNIRLEMYVRKTQ